MWRSKSAPAASLRKPPLLEEALTLLKQQERGPIQQKAPSGTRPIGEILDELMSDVPNDALDRLPVDGAEQHDHNQTFADTVYWVARINRGRP